MKPTIKNGVLTLDKGKIHVEFYPGDRWENAASKMKYEDTMYNLKKTLPQVTKEFERCYSEEQVLEKIIELATN